MSSQSLLTLTNAQWEKICDNCARCCLVKLQDEETNDIVYTNVACEYLDINNCRCTQYENRAKVKPECIVLDKHNLEPLKMMPFTCAYRLQHEERKLNQEPSNLSVKDCVISEKYIHDDQLPEHIIRWVSVKE